MSERAYRNGDGCQKVLHSEWWCGRVDLHLEQGDARAYEEQVVNVLYCRSAERAELGGQRPMAMEEFLCPSVAMAHDSEEDVDLD